MLSVEKQMKPCSLFCNRAYVGVPDESGGAKEQGHCLGDHLMSCLPDPDGPGGPGWPEGPGLPGGPIIPAGPMSPFSP